MAQTSPRPRQSIQRKRRWQAGLDRVMVYPPESLLSREAGFPDPIDAPPLKHRVTAAQHLDVFWPLNSKPGPNYFSPCLTTRRAVWIFLCGTSPRSVHHWIPFNGAHRLPGQPNAAISTEPPQAPSLTQKPVFLCFTHALNITSPVKHSPAFRKE